MVSQLDTLKEVDCIVYFELVLLAHRMADWRAILF